MKRDGDSGRRSLCGHSNAGGRHRSSMHGAVPSLFFPTICCRDAELLWRPGARPAGRAPLQGFRFSPSHCWGLLGLEPALGSLSHAAPALVLGGQASPAHQPPRTPLVRRGTALPELPTCEILL